MDYEKVLRKFHTTFEINYYQMQYFSVLRCPICGGDNLAQFLTCTDFFTTKQTFSLEKCQSCSFIFTQNFPVESEIGKYYEVTDYVSHSNTKQGIINVLYHFVRQYMLRRKSALVSRFSQLKEGKLLDYGSGTGHFLHEMDKNGWDLIGIEKSKVGREFSDKEFQLKINQPDFLFSVSAKSLDVITLWHVLEHIEDLSGVMLQFKRILKDSGVLILALPNADSFDAKYYKEHWAAYDVPRHLWHFTPTTLHQLAHQTGFKVEKQIAMPFDAFYISMMSEKNKGSRFAFLKGVIVGARAYLATIFKIEKSSSVIYILKNED